MRDTITYADTVITYISDAVIVDNDPNDFAGDTYRPPVRHYVATGEDKEGNRYVIKWRTRDDFWHQIDEDGICIDDCYDEEKDEASWTWQCEDDESYACDWCRPVSIRAV